MSEVDDPLKRLDDIFEPDPRSKWGQVYDYRTGLRDKTLNDHHAAIAEIVLLQAVPAGVRQLFETAKNLCLYAWFECRFHQPAELWAYGALEMALREKAKEASSDWWRKQTKSNKEPTLRRLLAKAKSEGWIKNEGFELWRRHQQLAAHQKAVSETLREMAEKGLTEAESPDYDDFEGVVGDPDYDYIAVLESTIPYFRNLMAHGWPTAGPRLAQGNARQ